MVPLEFINFARQALYVVFLRLENHFFSADFLEISHFTYPPLGPELHLIPSKLWLHLQLPSLFLFSCPVTFCPLYSQFPKMHSWCVKLSVLLALPCFLLLTPDLLLLQLSLGSLPKTIFVEHEALLLPKVS